MNETAALRKRIAELEAAEAEHKKVEERLRYLSSAAEQSPDGMAIADLEGRLTFVNRAWARMHGYESPEELVGKSLSIFHNEEQLEKDVTPFNNKLIKEGYNRGEVGHIRKDGRPFPTQMTGTVLKDQQGKPVAMAGVAMDITLRKQTEEETRTAEARFRELFDNMSSGVAVYEAREDGKDFVFVDFNRAAERIEAIKKEDLIGRSVPEVFPGVRDFGIFDVFQRVWKTGQPEHHPLSVYKDERISGWRDNYIYRLPSGEVVAVYDDVTERKKAEEEARYQRDYFRSLFDSSPEAVATLDLERRVLDVNPAFEKLFSYALEDIKGRNLDTFILPQGKEGEGEDISRRASLREIATAETVRRTADGREIPVSLLGAPIIVEGTQIGILAIYRDISKRKKAEEEARYQRDYFRSLFDSSPEAVVSIDMDRRVTDANPAFEKLFGYALEDIKGRDIHTFILPRGKETEGKDLNRRASQGETVAAETVRQAADGREIPVSHLGAPIIIADRQIGLLAIYRDVTERKKAEERLERSFVDLAETVSRAEEYHDPYTSLHQRRVARLVRAVGEKMGLDRDRLLGLEIGGLLHDIGKMSTPESILHKPGALSQEEWNLVRLHARQGYEILQASNLPWPVAEMVLHHHERLDGSGYPDGIGGDELSPECRILAACNVAEAMSTHRPYRPARSRAEIVEELRRGRGTEYDAAVVDILLEMVEAGALEPESPQP